MNNILVILIMIFLTSCASMMQKSEKVDLIDLSGDEKVVIYYTTNFGHLEYASYKIGGGYHYGTTTPKDLHENFKKALKWDDELGQSTKEIEKEIARYFSGITIKYYRTNSYSPSILICYQDANYQKISKLDCGWIHGRKKIEEAIYKTSPEYIKIKDEEIKKKRDLKNKLK